MKSTIRTFLAVALAGWVAAPAPAGRAAVTSAPDSPATTRPASQPAGQPATAPGIQDDLLAAQERLRQIAGDTSLSAGLRDLLTQRYEQAAGFLKDAVAFTRQAGVFRRAATDAPRRLQAIGAELAALTSQPDTTGVDGMSAEQVAARVEQAKADLEPRQAQAAAIENEATARSARKTAIPGEIAKASQALEAANRDLASLPVERTPADASPWRNPVAARQAMLGAQARALVAQIEALTREQASLDATEALLAARRALAARQLASAESAVRWWSAARSAQAGREAQRDAASAQRASEELPAELLGSPRVRMLATENARLAALRIGPDGLVARLEATERDAAAAAKDAARLREDFARVQADIAAAGLHEAMGRVLLRQQTELERLSRYADDLPGREAAAADVQGQLIDYRHQSDDLADPVARADEMAAELKLPAGQSQGEAARQIGPLLIARREILRHLVDENTRYLAALSQLTRTERQIIADAGAFTRYIDQRILWVRSMPPLKVSDLPAAVDGFKWLGQASRWQTLGRQAAGQDAADHAVLYLLALAVLAAMIATRSRAQGRIGDLGHHISSRQQAPQSNTYRVLLLTIWRSLPWPGVMLLAGWRLTAVAAGQGQKGWFAGTVGAALLAAGWVFLGLLSLHELCRRGGLGRLHFR
ncbi:MAG: hypothetical protein PHU85_11585, partial [Phycisphaerae bacterium]|nr:hypothetical protein [Phycisphaerae bacterium]